MIQWDTGWWDDCPPLSTPSFFLCPSYCGIRSARVRRGKTNTRPNDEDEESFYINRRNPIISLCEQSWPVKWISILTFWFDVRFQGARGGGEVGWQMCDLVWMGRSSGRGLKWCAKRGALKARYGKTHANLFFLFVFVRCVSVCVLTWGNISHSVCLISESRSAWWIRNNLDPSAWLQWSPPMRIHALSHARRAHADKHTHQSGSNNQNPFLDISISISKFSKIWDREILKGFLLDPLTKKMMCAFDKWGHFFFTQQFSAGEWWVWHHCVGMSGIW